MSDTKTLDTQLQIVDPLALKTEIAAPMVTIDAELDKKAEAYATALVEVNPEDLKAREGGKASVENMGVDLQRKAAKQSEMLRQPVKVLAERAEDGGTVAKSLIDLKLQVESLDPGKIDLEPGWFSRTLGRLPGVGTPLKRYFTKYESAQTVIGAVIRSLENGRDQLQRDIVTLTEDQKRMREMTKKLEEAAKLGQLIDQKLQYKLDREIEANSEKHKFVSEELVFPLRQRILDLQQQLAVNQQGVLATEIIIRNNKELVRGVNRALNVTVEALQVGVTVAMALANQKVVLDKIGAVNKTTSDLISGTAARLKTQGVAIHKQASGTMIDMEALKSAFADINTAMEDISQFRRNALPQMAASVVEMDKLTKAAGAVVEKMEQGNRSRPEIKLQIE